jgi:hypothetical protein
VQGADDVRTAPRVDLNEDELRAKLRKLAASAPDSRAPPQAVATVVRPHPLNKPISKPQLALAIVVAALIVITAGPVNVLLGLITVRENIRSYAVGAYDWAITGDNYRFISGSMLALIACVLVLKWLGEAVDECGRRAFERDVAIERASRPAPIITSPYFRKKDTIKGDARTADDFEVDQALRDNLGGFAPMFKD